MEEGGLSGACSDESFRCWPVARCTVSEGRVDGGVVCADGQCLSIVDRVYVVV